MIGVIMSKKLRCPCCGYYTIDSRDEVVTEICEVCLWQYDEVAHANPDNNIGANKVSLNEAKENYIQYGVSKEKYIGKNIARLPRENEITEEK